MSIIKKIINQISTAPPNKFGPSRGRGVQQRKSDGKCFTRSAIELAQPLGCA